MDAATLAALGREIVYVQWFAWIDIVDDPVRAVSGGRDILFGASATGDPDLDGKLYQAVPSDLVSISDVGHSEGGSDTVTAQLRGLPVEDGGLLDIVGQKAKWRKREARLWFRVLEPVDDKATQFTCTKASSIRVTRAPNRRWRLRTACTKQASPAASGEAPREARAAAEVSGAMAGWRSIIDDTPCQLGSPTFRNDR